MSCDQTQQVFFGLEVRSLFDLSGEIQIVPAYDAVFDEAIACLCDFGFVCIKVPNPPQDLAMFEARLSGQAAAA